MIDETLQEFMSKVDIKNKDVVIYINNEKGVMYPLSVAHLLCRVDYLELEKGNSKQAGKLEEAIFQKKIDNKDYKIVDIEKIVPKYEITKIEADRYTLTTKKCKGAKIYNVSNQAGIHTTFEDKEEAFKLCEEINNRVIASLK